MGAETSLPEKYFDSARKKTAHLEPYQIQRTETV